MNDEIDQQKLITEHQRRLQKLKEQQARLGFNTPPEILNEIEDIEAELKRLQSRLTIKHSTRRRSNQPGPADPAIATKIKELEAKTIQLQTQIEASNREQTKSSPASPRPKSPRSPASSNSETQYRIVLAWTLTGRKQNISFSLFDLSGQDFETIDLARAKLNRANLSGANLAMTNLSQADLRRANLSDADLSEADLRGADLRKADLRRANLQGTDLSEFIERSRGSDRYFEFVPFLRTLDKADSLPEGYTRLDNADLTEATYDHKTKWPAHFDPEQAGVIKVSSHHTFVISGEMHMPSTKTGTAHAKSRQPLTSQTFSTNRKTFHRFGFKRHLKTTGLLAKYKVKDKAHGGKPCTFTVYLQDRPESRTHHITTYFTSGLELNTSKIAAKLKEMAKTNPDSYFIFEIYRLG